MEEELLLLSHLGVGFADLDPHAAVFFLGVVHQTKLGRRRESTIRRAVHREQPDDRSEQVQTYRATEPSPLPVEPALRQLTRLEQKRQQRSGDAPIELEGLAESLDYDRPQPTIEIDILLAAIVAVRAAKSSSAVGARIGW